jgi:hypothetical protein
LSSVVEYSHLEFSLLKKKFPCLQELPPTEPTDQGDEGEWDTVGEAIGSRSPAPTVEELLAQMERQPPAAQEGAEPAVAAAEEAAEGAVATEVQEEVPAEAVAVEAQEEAPAEAGLVDIASILGARDSSPVKPVSVESSRVVLDVVVELD